jgi:hypothetical protein
VTERTERVTTERTDPTVVTPDVPDPQRIDPTTGQPVRPAPPVTVEDDDGGADETPTNPDAPKSE